MNVVVCVKQVPDTETNIRIAQSGKEIDLNDVNLVMNPYDEYAVEAALQLKEKQGSGEVVIVSLGGAKTPEVLRTALAMGADRAIWVKLTDGQQLDPHATAKALHEVISRLDYDLILCGKQAIDDDMGAVGIELAELLGIPHASVVVGLELSDDGGSVRVEREVEGGRAVYECRLPAVLTTQKGLNLPRYPSLKGIMKAKRKPLEEVELAAEAINTKLDTVELSYPPQRKSGIIVDGESPAEKASKLVELLHGEAKVI